MLYLDLTEAFYRILRPLVVGGAVDDSLVIYVGARLGLSEDLLQDLHRHLDEMPATAAAGLPAHMQNTIRALHEDTHFHIRGQTDTCRTELGSRPGDSFADVIFSYLWGRILHRLQGQLHELGLGEQINEEHRLRLPSTPVSMPQPQQGFLGPTWMDDTCVCVSDSCHERLERKITHASGLLLSLCESHGLTPNLQPGKSEVLLVFQGRGARKMRIRYFGPNSDKTLLLVGEMGTKKIRVVNQYSHLGCLIHHRPDNRREARRRVGIAQQAFNHHRRLLFSNPVLSMTRRKELFCTLIMSKFCYGTESWTLSERQTKTYIHNALIRLFRRLSHGSYNQHLQDDDVLTATGLNSPTEILRLARLRYIGTLHRCSDLVPWGLLNADEEWTTLVQDDLLWMWSQLHGTCSLPDPQSDLTPWVSIWQHHASYWKRLVKRAGLHACFQRRNHHRVLAFHRRFIQLFKEHPATHEAFDDIGIAPAWEKGDDELPHACMCCRLVFKSKGGLGAHMFKVHHIVAKVRILCDQTQCSSCLREYHTMAKLKAHLQRSGPCRHRLWGRRRYFHPAQGSGSNADAHLHQQQDLLPPLQAAGPHLPDGRLEDIPEYDLELAEKIYMALLERAERCDIAEIIKEVVYAYPVSWQTCRASLHYLIGELTIEDIQMLAITHKDIKMVLRELLASEEWSFLLDTNAHSRTVARPFDQEAIDQKCIAAAESGTSREPFWTCPRPMLRERYIIHAFSGRRRPGDFQYFLDQMQSQHDATTIHTVSVDLMTDPIWGDISRPEVRSFWLTAVRDRFVIGALAGPPCETWSQARGKVMSPPAERPTRPSPRVLRDLLTLWGRAAIAIRELQQLDTGNLLLLFTVELLIMLAYTGGIGCMEHPAPPDDPTKASIWRLPIICYLMTWPEFAFLTLSQGLWGAPSMKPTGLLLLNAPEMLRELRSWQIAKDVPHQTAIGLTSDGFWATSFLKEYPPALCAGLAGGFHKSLQGHPVDDSFEVSSEFQGNAQRMTVREYGQCAGPDFAP